MNNLYINKLLLLLGLVLFFTTLVFGQTDSLSTSESHASVLLKKSYDPKPVIPFHDTLFYINMGFGAFTPAERAESITEKIRTLCKNRDFKSDSIKIFMEGNYAYIFYNDLIIMTITENDALFLEKTQSNLVNEYKSTIENCITQRQKDTKLFTILWRTLIIVLIIVVQYFIIKFLNRLFRKLFKKIEALKGTKLKTIKFRSYKLMDEEKVAKFIIFIFKAVRFLLILLMFYLSIPLAFSVFPVTRGFAGILFGYVLTPLKTISLSIVKYIPNLIKIIIIVIIFRYLIKGVRFLAEEIEKGRLILKGFFADWAYPTFNIIRILLYAFMFVLIFPLLPGSDSSIFQGVSIFIGVIISLGSTSVINNLISGLVLTYMRPFKIGDRIKIGEVVGNVIEKTPLVTRMRTPKNEEITIPNSNIMAAQTLNYSHSARTHKLVLHTELTFGYDTPWRKVHELLLSAASRTSNILEKPKPFILQTALDDFYAEYQLNVYIGDADKMPLIYSNLRQNIQDVFSEAGLDMTVVHYRAHVDRNKTTNVEASISCEK